MRFDAPDRPDVPCSSDPDLWFSENPADQAKARGVCSTCPFQVSCLELKDTSVEVPNGEVENGATVYPHAEHGIWGGVNAEMIEAELTPKKRQMLARAEEVKALLAEGLTPYAIGLRLEVSRTSVVNIIENYLTQEATA